MVKSKASLLHCVYIEIKHDIFFIDPWLTSKSGECPLCKFDCSSDNKSEATVADDDSLIAAATVPGLRGMLLRTYLRFKANRRRRIGQVGNLPNSTQQPQQSSRQSTMITSTEGSPSFGSLAAIRAVEAIESVNNINRVSITEAVAAEAAAASGEGEYENNVSVTRTPTTTTVLTQMRIITPQEEVFADEEQSRTSSTIDRESILAIMHDEAQPRSSNVALGYASTINTITSTFIPASDGRRLPDIDTSSISLCSIDLGGIIEEFQLQSFYSQ